MSNLDHIRSYYEALNTGDAQWYIEHGIEQGDEAVIEWTMTWRDPRSGDRRLDRGTEWFLFRDGKIAEVRAYHHGNKNNPRGDAAVRLEGDGTPHRGVGGGRGVPARAVQPLR